MSNITFDKTTPTFREKATSLDTRVKSSLSISSYSHQKNNWFNCLAIGYTFGGYGLSLLAITKPNWWLNLLGVLMLIHTLSWAGFFLHEFFHHNIFATRKLNVIFGQAMQFLTGSCYSRFRDLAQHHIVHHIKRVDLSPFSPPSLTDFLKSLPKPLQKIIAILELLYFPVVNLTLRWMIALAPFLGETRKDERFRNGLFLLIRGGLFTALAIYSPRGVILYFIGYICFLNITQFLECFQHTFPAFCVNEEIPKYNLKHEEENTYTLVISRYWRWLDLIVFLNHNYHNAHHTIMTCPWYLLEKLDTQLYPDNYQQRISVFKLFGNYFHPRYRLRRLFSGQGNVERTEQGLSLENFVGATGMSFLMLREPFDWLKIPPTQLSDV